MIRTLLTICSFILIFSSCKKHNDLSANSEFYRLDSLKAKYLFSHDVHLDGGGIVNADAWFYFDGQNILKRVGANLTGTSSGGYSGVYSKAVYDTVFWQNGNLVLETMDTFSFANVQPSRRELTFENNKLIKKITRASLPNVTSNDTIYYYYNTKGVLEKTMQYLRLSTIERIYSYDANDNLQRIDWKFTNRNPSILTYTAEEVFSDYDNSPNILKAYYLWEDIFPRTLSKNNFRSYSYKKFSVSSGLIQEQEQRNWSYTYDNNGRIDFSR